MASLLAIDYGHKKLGFAVGQTITGTATPLAVVKQNGEMWKKVDAIFAEWQPTRVIIGQPKLADGKKHPLEKMIEKFIKSLEARYNVSISREDETLTSFEAAEFQSPKDRKTPVDAHAAALFLESWMRYNNP
ncbi:MAG: Holliday junction resolvase RuvX [Gammaproteobacteria bacterium]|nr:MAG: Holliday junction resolvase RuvX [Gammaproteobacteria bacterium]